MKYWKRAAWSLSPNPSNKPMAVRTLCLKTPVGTS